MICIGHEIMHSHQDVLEPVSEEALYELIANPSPALNSLVGRLQRTLQISKQAYDSLKKQLPYFCCSEFVCNLRNTQNFRSISHFTIDLDGLKMNAEDFTALRKRLCEDEEVLMGFVTPSGVGFKLLFRLAEPVTDTKMFTDFYKSFAMQVASKYDIQQYVDFKTCDVTRVSFLSADPEAYFNADARAVLHTDYVGDVDLFRDDANDNYEVKKREDEDKNLTANQYKKILEKLNPQAAKPSKPAPIVPEILSEIVAPITDKAAELDLNIKEVIDIQYGKKFVFVHDFHTAEVNVFYGRKGFSVVKTPKTKCDPDLTEVAFQLINHVLYGGGEGSNGQIEYIPETEF